VTVILPRVSLSLAQWTSQRMKSALYNASAASFPREGIEMGQIGL
jgi:hypothetical protein